MWRACAAWGKFMTRLVALDTSTLAIPATQWNRFRAFGTFVAYDNTPHTDADTIVERAEDADVLLLNKVVLTAEILRRLPSLKCVCILATGYNVVDIAAARAAGIAVCNVPAYGTDSVAQHALALLLELSNHVAKYNASVHAGDWVRSDKFWYQLDPVHELAGKTAGIVGWGAIGRKTAAVLHALGMRVLASSRTRKNAPDWADFSWADSMDDVFARSDVVSLHCPQTEETAGMVNAARLALMKPTALLVNTARGGLVDEAALADALRRGAIAGAALDVVAEEPMRADNPLLVAPRCVITPHIAWASDEATSRLFETTFENVCAFLDGGPRNNVAAR